jgi:hypothetical protein
MEGHLAAIQAISTSRKYRLVQAILKRARRKVRVAGRQSARATCGCSGWFEPYVRCWWKADWRLLGEQCREAAVLSDGARRRLSARCGHSYLRHPFPIAVVHSYAIV